MYFQPGIIIDHKIGIGDAIQFTSAPENFFRHTGRKMVDVTKHWVFDSNPYVVRGVPHDPGQSYEFWGHSPVRPRMLEYMDANESRARTSTFTSNAEIVAKIMGVPVVLNRPRLYRFEDFPMQKRTRILIHTNGRSHGQMPQKVIDHILKKYEGMDLAQIGLGSDIDLGIPRIVTASYWELAREISQARMLIGMDSGPSWIAACYPDVIVKRLRTRPSDLVRLTDWIPLDFANPHSYWDDRAFQIYNPSEDDVGFTQSYRRI